MIPSSDDLNYITDDDFLRHLRHYTPGLETLPVASADHSAVSGPSANAPGGELLKWIGHITRRDVRVGEISGLSQEEAVPGGAPTEEGVARRHSPIAGEAGVARGNLPGNTTGGITAASTAESFESRRDACSYACWHCSTIPH